MPTLKEITGGTLELLKAVEAGEMSQDDIADTLESLSLEFNDKAAAIISVCQERESVIPAIDAEIKRLQERKRTLLSKSEQMKDWLRHNMEATGITKIECPLFSISIRKGVESVSVTDIGALPDHLIKVEVTTQPDKAAIKEAIKNGEPVRGAELVRGKSSIIIK